MLFIRGSITWRRGGYETRPYIGARRRAQRQASLRPALTSIDVDVRCWRESLTDAIPIGTIHVMDNRNVILYQALILFAERGYDAVGVQDIAVASGITKPTLYHYFGSKRGLLDALLREEHAHLESLLDEAARYRGDLPLTLTRTVQVLFQFARERPLFYRLYLSMWFALPYNEAHTAAAPFHASLFHQIEQIFIDAARDHGNMRGRQRANAATLLGTINTYIAMAINDQAALDEATVHQVVKQFSYGIYS